MNQAGIILIVDLPDGTEVRYVFGSVTEALDAADKIAGR